MENALKGYKEGKVSIGKATKIANVTVHEMMEAVAKGIKTEETLEDLRKGVRILVSV